MNRTLGLLAALTLASGLTACGASTETNVGEHELNAALARSRTAQRKADVATGLAAIAGYCSETRKYTRSQAHLGAGLLVAAEQHFPGLVYIRRRTVDDAALDAADYLIGCELDDDLATLQDTIAANRDVK